jgi:tetratricopeptide (TPR) repeat protein
MHDLALVLHRRGKYAEAEKLHREVLKKRRQVLTYDHPRILTSMSGVASALEAQGEYPEAEKAFRELFSKCEEILGEDHPTTFAAMDRLAASLYRQGRLEEAVKIQQELVSRLARKRIPDETRKVYRDRLAGYKEELTKKKEEP